MTHRERVLKCLNHEEGDRIPIDLGGWLCGVKPIAYDRLCRYLGIRNDGTTGFTPCEELLQRWGIDFRRVTPKGPPNRRRKMPDGSVMDDWRVIRVHQAGDDQITHFPLQNATIEDLKTAAEPDPALPWEYAQAREQALQYRARGFAVVAQPNCQGVFEQANWLCGFERLLTDIMADPDFTRALFEKITRNQERFAKDYYGTVGDSVDIVQLGDDFGTQNCPFISDEVYREMIRPYQMRYHAAIRAGTNAKLFHHSCGSVYRLLKSMIESGIQILNPVQLSAAEMDADRLKAEFGDRLVFHGAIDVQKVLPVKSPREIREEVRRVIRALAPGGGYILAPSHNIQDDTPPENIVAMYDAAVEFGSYPIRG